MSLQHAANHLAAQGRNGDSMLMHVTPREVSGLQALAQRHGGSLTTNPHTGLPEANFLNDIGLGDLNKFAPAIAGFALDTFLPGAGQAVGGMFGLSGAAGTAGIVGGLSALSSGNLSQGIMAGLGAYGGASLAEGLIGAGGAASNSATQAAAQAADAGASGPLSGSAFSNSAALDRTGQLAAGVSDAFKQPGEFFGNNKWAMAAAALPALADMGKQGTLAAQKNKGYIRRYAKNPETGALEQVEAVPVDDWGGRSAVTFGGVGAPVKGMAAGGVTHVVYNEATKKYDTVNADGTPVGPVTFGGVGKRVNMQNPDDPRSDSQKAYDYLMGRPNSKNPMLFYHDNNASSTSNLNGPITPLDLNTRTGGHYVLNPSGTGYDWVPDVAPTTNAGLDAIVDNSSRGTGATDPTGGNTGNTNGVGYTNDAMGRTMVGLENGLGIAGSILTGKIANLFNLGDTNQYQPEVVDKSTLSPDAQREAQDRAIALQDAKEAAERTAPIPHPDNDADPNGYGTTSSNAGMADSGPNTGARDSDPGPGPGPGPSPGASMGGPNGAGFGPTSGNAPSPTGKDSGDHGDGGGGGGGSGPGGPGRGGGIGGGGMGAGQARGGLNLHGQYLPPRYAQGGIAALASGGYSSLGGYSDGGQLLRGPGDGVSDSIPATIGKGQPARLADGEFVIPARIVSELGNGSTEAGAKQLYAMMARIQATRAKTTGKNSVAKNSKAARHLPA